jgi:subfamily B ATP-binding cassette protein MsbA
MQRSISATTEVFRILDLEPTVKDAPSAIELPFAKGRLDFENVTFRYANTVTDAVKDLNLHIEPGKTYALVGASGAGKSTILSLILRLYDPTSGAVKIEGRDLRTITQKSLRQQIGLVTQETFLFHDTIFNNIQFGRLDATPEEVYEAAHTAFAHDFIMAQPKTTKQSSVTRLSPLGWTTAASCDCTRRSEKCADPTARRGDIIARFESEKQIQKALENSPPDEP